MLHNFRTPNKEEKEFAKRLRITMKEPSFKMWLRDLLCEEIKRQNEKSRK